MKLVAEAAKPNVDYAQPAARSRAAGGIGFIPMWTLYVLTIRQHLHGKRWMVMGVLFLLPVGLAVLLRATASHAPALGIEFLLVFFLIPQALLPLMALVYAAGIIQDEQEEQTLTYLLIRPLRRWAIYLVKLLATLTTTIALTAVFTILTYATIYIGSGSDVANVPRRCLSAVAIHCLSVGAYCCLFGLIGLYTRRALIAGILYTAVIEGLLANLPFGLRLITVIYYARILAYRSLDFVVEDHGHREDIAATAWQLDVRNDPELVNHPESATCVIVLLVAGIACALFGALLCARREFHVKTPEGS